MRVIAVALTRSEAHRSAPSPTCVSDVLLIEPRGFCAGVEMAVKALVWMVRAFGTPVYCYHEVVHNQVVVKAFRDLGVVFVDSIDAVPDGAPLMLSAHGSAPDVRIAASARSGPTVDAVCPLVEKVHHEIRSRVAAGDVIVLVGHHGHDEAIGSLAIAPDRTHLVQSVEELQSLRAQGSLADASVAVLGQTTLSLDEWTEVATEAERTIAQVWSPRRSDLCFATTNRQGAVRATAPVCDAMVVVGSANSSNTAALVRVAREAGCPRVVRVDRPEQLPALAGVVAVTAGASAPEAMVQAVVEHLAPGDRVRSVVVGREDEYFPMPRDLRALFAERTSGDPIELEVDGRAVGADSDREVPAEALLVALVGHQL